MCHSVMSFGQPTPIQTMHRTSPRVPCGLLNLIPHNTKRITGMFTQLFKDLLTKTEGATWFEKVKDRDGRAACLLLREHSVGEAHDQRRAASAHAKLKSLFWKNKSSFPFEKFLSKMNEAFMEKEDAGQPLYPQQRSTGSFAGTMIFRFRLQLGSSVIVTWMTLTMPPWLCLVPFHPDLRALNAVKIKGVVSVLSIPIRGEALIAEEAAGVRAAMEVAALGDAWR